jgi:hypothetical protein
MRSVQVCWCSVPAGSRGRGRRISSSRPAQAKVAAKLHLQNQLKAKGWGLAQWESRHEALGHIPSMRERERERERKEVSLVMAI